VPVSVCGEGEGEPTHGEHATTCGSAPLRPRRNRQTSLWHGGLGPRVIFLGRRYLRIEKSHRRSRQYRVLGAAAEDGEVKFSKPMQRLEASRAWPNKAIKCGGHGSVSRRDRRGSRRDHGRTGSSCINGRAGAASQSPIKLWPYLQARILP
jgi:hypothetical protein